MRCCSRCGAVVSGGIYTREASQRTHDRLAQVTRTALGAGYTVLVDATFLNAALRARFIALAAALQAPCRILSFEAPLDVLRAAATVELVNDSTPEALREKLQSVLGHI